MKRWGFLIALGLATAACNPSAERVVVYASQDQVYSQPILAQFERETGIDVEALYDSEAVKTVGLFRRLLSERQRPQCDVFWNNEELRTRQLAAHGVFRPRDGWAPFGYRSRRLVVNTNMLSIEQAPQSLLALTNATWSRKVVFAYPLFGSTGTHFLALRQHWGEEGWLAWCRALQANKPFVVDGNSIVVQMVGRGEAPIGLTDSDDILSGQRAGMPIAAMPFGAEMLLIANTVGVVRDGPNPAAADALFQFLRRADVVLDLVSRGAIEGVAPPQSAALDPDWAQVMADLDEATEQMRQIFLR